MTIAEEIHKHCEQQRLSSGTYQEDLEKEEFEVIREFGLLLFNKSKYEKKLERLDILEGRVLTKNKRQIRKQIIYIPSGLILSSVVFLSLEITPDGPSSTNNGLTEGINILL